METTSDGAVIGAGCRVRDSDAIRVGDTRSFGNELARHHHGFYDFGFHLRGTAPGLYLFSASFAAFRRFTSQLYTLAMLTSVIVTLSLTNARSDLFVARFLAQFS